MDDRQIVRNQQTCDVKEPSRPVTACALRRQVSRKHQGLSPDARGLPIGAIADQNVLRRGPSSVRSTMFRINRTRAALASKGMPSHYGMRSPLPPSTRPKPTPT